MAAEDKVGLPDVRTRSAVRSYLFGVCQEMGGLDIADPKVAGELDLRDTELKDFRKKFHLPKIGELLDEHERATDVDPSEDCIYFCGNSLGLQPVGTKEIVNKELDKWAKRALRGHTTGAYPWLPIEDFVVEESARIVGAKQEEVAVMNSLTVNVHLGLVPFYRPTKERFKILTEERPFPSDYYAVQSQVHWHGYDPSTAMISVSPRQGEAFIRTEDVLKVIEEEGDSIALVYFGGVHFFTGQFFDMKAITEAAHNKGCRAGFDLAHAAGNVELHLHDWQVDFACWCTYKYMNAGPGGIAGFFIHEKHAKDFSLPRLLGWWSHKRESRFVMDNVLDLQPGAAGFQLSNPPVLETMALYSSLQVFKETSMSALCCKSRILTGYIELLLEEKLKDSVSVLTPSDPLQRGCQLSLKFSHPVDYVYEFLQQRGVVSDIRKPDVMRISPAPLYNSFSDASRFVKLLQCALSADMQSHSP